MEMGNVGELWVLATEGAAPKAEGAGKLSPGLGPQIGNVQCPVISEQHLAGVLLTQLAT